MKKILNKLVNIFLVFGIFLSLLPLSISAEETSLGIVKSSKGNGINVRSGPGTGQSNKIIGTGIADNQIVTIYDTIKTNDGSTGCESGTWYKIKYLQVESGIGYACSSFIQILDSKVDDEFEATLLTFPESYKPYLRVLHNIYPNAVFTAYYTGLNFNEVVKNESVEGKSLIWDSNSSRDGLKLLESFSFDTNNFRNNYPGGGSNWYAANSQTISYYIDPRNFLNETRVFMFESLSYNPMYHNNINGIESVLKSSFMYNSYVDGKQEKKFSDVIMSAAVTYGVSPYYIVSRILQETGNTRSALVLGTYPNYPEFNGYYNFYNFGATGNEIVKNGLTYAYNHGWNSEEFAIFDGARLIANSYISAGQDTNYSQKWNVVCKTGSYSCYTHEYMQNIEAPYSEAKTTYNAYKNSLGNDMYNISYLFTIPVFENMPEKTSLPSSDNPINYLKDIIVNKSLLPNFDPETYEYNVLVPYNTTSISVEANSVSSKASISGTGTISILNDSQDIILTVTAQNGTSKNYVLHIIKEEKKDPSQITLSEAISNITGIKIGENTISGVTSVEVLKQKINESSTGINLNVKTKDGKVITSGNLGTGYKIGLELNDEYKEYEMVLYGDNNGDAEITILDLLRVQKQLLKSISLSGVEYNSCDVNKDGSVTILDLLLIQKHLLGSKYIDQ